MSIHDNIKDAKNEAFRYKRRATRLRGVVVSQKQMIEALYGEVELLRQQLGEAREALSKPSLN